MMSKHFRRPVIAEYSGDASTIGTVVLRDPAGTTVTLATGEGFCAGSLQLVTSVAARVDVINDVDAGGDVDAGERVVGGNFAANGGIACNFTPFVFFKIGTLPKVKSDTSGVQTLTINGFIYH
jgi:hypothetical protein